MHGFRLAATINLTFMLFRFLEIYAIGSNAILRYVIVLLALISGTTIYARHNKFPKKKLYIRFR